MAVVSQAKDSKLRIKYIEGIDVEGNNIVKTKTYSKVKAESADADVYAAADAMMNLQSKSIEEIARIDEEELVDEV
ncbi:MAG: DUF1659 domain-containing protein [Peptostreptococcaceae bacterium]|nr:DUF1659 domain-containing protein [Peptostreptococcaceae bacterium]